jgi:hypothetical protein
MATVQNIANSFVTFYNLSNNTGIPEYVTDTICGIQKDFCYPIFDEKDLQFQTQISSTEVISSITIQKTPSSTGVSVSVTGVTTDIITNGTIDGKTIYNIWFSFSGSDLMDGILEGDCFIISFFCGIAEPTFFISNQCFKKVADKCLTTQLKYINSENAFGFVYRTVGTYPNITATTNTIRLPIYLKEPIINSEKTVYVRSNGARELLSARLSKRYKALVDHVPEETHQNIVVALNHDGVYLWPENYSKVTGMRVTFEDEYNNDFPAIMQNVNIWAADFTIFETPFNNFNSNCV